MNTVVLILSNIRVLILSYHIVYYIHCYLCPLWCPVLTRRRPAVTWLSKSRDWGRSCGLVLIIQTCSETPLPGKQCRRGPLRTISILGGGILIRAGLQQAGERAPQSLSTKQGRGHCRLYRPGERAAQSQTRRQGSTVSIDQKTGQHSLYGPGDRAAQSL